MHTENEIAAGRLKLMLIDENRYYPEFYVNARLIKKRLWILMMTTGAKVIRHILFITFTDSALPEQILAVRTAFLQIPIQIEGVTGVEWGINNSPEGRNSGFTHCVLMTFADEAARQRYLPHPVHEALKVIFRPVLRDIMVLDYTVDP
ncbi:Dabb family protein [Enterobacter asburiae]|uniref:Dabb family protein n=1 Tax=Enterobacter asburiae TaxID=61645 RepID=UPI003F55C7B9